MPQKSDTVFFLFQEIGISVQNYHKIKQLEAEKDIIFLHGGVGGYHRPSVSLPYFVKRGFHVFVKKYQHMSAYIVSACSPTSKPFAFGKFSAFLKTRLHIQNPFSRTFYVFFSKIL